MNNRVLFFTNTPPEYRIPLYQELTSKYPVTFVFTAMELANKIYKWDLDDEKMSRIRYHVLPTSKGKLSDIKKCILDKDVKCVVVPPLDSIKETIFAYWIFIWAKLKRKKTIYFWGKWEAPNDKQPIKKRVKNTIQRIVSRPIIRYCNYTMGYGTKACEYLLSNGADRNRCSVAFYTSMSPICNQTNWRESNNIPSDRKCVLYFGRVIEKKGLRFLIDAFDMLDEEIKQQLWLVVAGDGSDKVTLENYAKQRKIKNISWIGYVHPDKRYDYYSQCEMFVLPTYYHQGSVEAWGMTMNEAMQCGNILIATEAVGSAYDLINEHNGCIARAGDAKSLSEAISDALLLKNRDEVVSEDNRLLETYNYQNSSNRFISIFEKCINEGECNG